MEKVFWVQSAILPSSFDGTKPFLQAVGVIIGKNEKTILPGGFVVALGNGSKIIVNGPAGLKIGDKVKVLLPSSKPIDRVVEANQKEIRTEGRSSQWSALIPLAFGGNQAHARLQVFVEDQTFDLPNKNVPAVYFLFTTQTEWQGTLQWSVYLKGRQVAVQVYAEAEKKPDLKKIIFEVEKKLKSLGFVMVTPTVFLRKPFRIPEGFRLNVKG